MDKNEFLKAIKDIGTTEDEVHRRDLLTKLSDDISNIFDTNESLKTTNDKLTQDNKQYCDDMETLRQANMKLFLRVGGEKTEDNNSGNAENNDEPSKPREFKDLFNEKGELK